MALEAQVAALHSSVDGRGLESVALVGGEDALLNGTTLMTGGMFINAMKIRGNLMMTKPGRRGGITNKTQTVTHVGGETLAHCL